MNIVQNKGYRMRLKYQSIKTKGEINPNIEREKAIVEMTALGTLFEELSKAIKEADTLKMEKELSKELQMLGELFDELIHIKNLKDRYCCKARNLLHCIQGLFELKGIDVGNCIGTMVEIMEDGITDGNWETINEYVLDLYKTAFLNGN